MGHTRVIKKPDADVMRGDAVLVTRMAVAEGLNEGKGFSHSYVKKVLNNERKNKQISALHRRVVRMRAQLIKA